MTPIAFNLTPRLKACLPSGRDYSTLLALYEALQEAAVFEMAAAPISVGSVPVADEDGWIEWGGGIPAVFCPGQIVETRHRGGGEYTGNSAWAWDHWFDGPGFWVHDGSYSDIIAYRLVNPAGDPDGWIPHKAGDPIPCNPNLAVEFRMRDGIEFNEYARNINWDAMPTAHSCEVTHWRPAQSEK